MDFDELSCLCKKLFFYPENIHVYVKGCFSSYQDPSSLISPKMSLASHNPPIHLCAAGVDRFPPPRHPAPLRHKRCGECTVLASEPKLGLPSIIHSFKKTTCWKAAMTHLFYFSDNSAPFPPNNNNVILTHYQQCVWSIKGGAEIIMKWDIITEFVQDL